MTDVAFYQLTKPLDVVLPRLLEKALAAGHRVAVRAADAALLKRLDEALWTYDAASFLPHAVDGEHAAQQPVLLTASQALPANDATVLAIVDGVMPNTPADFDRLLYLFDGDDSAALGAARAEWRRLKSKDGPTASYWRENEAGRWEQAA